MRNALLSLAAVSAFIAGPALAAASPQSFMDATKAPTDALQAAACVASTEKTASTIEALATQTAMDSMQYMSQGMGQMTAAAGDAMSQLISPEFQTCALMLPSQALQGFVAVGEQLQQKLDGVRAERDKLCNAQPDQGEAGCDASIANRIVRPRVGVAVNAYYASAAAPLARLKAEALSCIVKRQPLEEKLIPAGGAMAMQGVTARAGDLTVAGAYVAAVHELCVTAVAAQQEFAQ